MRRASAIVVLLFVACGGSATTPGDGPRICTEIACTDQFTATLHGANGALPAGKQVVTITANGTTLTCSFTLPRATVQGGAVAAVTCPKGLAVSVVQAQSCVASGTGAYQTQTCTPLPGKLDELVTLVGSPTTLEIKQTVDGATYLDETTTPTYTVNRPNGPTCDPACSQASGQFVLAAQ